MKQEHLPPFPRVCVCVQGCVLVTKGRHAESSMLPEKEWYIFLVKLLEAKGQEGIVSHGVQWLCTDWAALSELFASCLLAAWRTKLAEKKLS